jgi:hypothetical protein
MSRVCNGFLTLPRVRKVMVFRALGTLKHAQIAAVEWNREAIARVKAGVDVYGALAAMSRHV